MLSYARGPEAPVFEKTIHEAFTDAVRRDPAHDALIVVHQDVRLSYRRVGRKGRTDRAGLAGLGLRPGDRVGVWASNCLEWILLQLGCARAGIVLVNVNPAYRSVDLAYVLRKSRMRALFLRERDARADYRAILEEARLGQNLPLEHTVFIGHESWDRMLAGGIDIAWDAPLPTT